MNEPHHTTPQTRFEARATASGLVELTLDPITAERLRDLWWLGHSHGLVQGDLHVALEQVIAMSVAAGEAAAATGILAPHRFRVVAVQPELATAEAQA